MMLSTPGQTPELETGGAETNTGPIAVAIGPVEFVSFVRLLLSKLKVLLEQHSYECGS